MDDQKSADDANKKSLVVSDQEIGNRNKRKFLSVETPDAPAISLTEFPRYELLQEKLRSTLSELEALEGGHPQSNENQGVETPPPEDLEDPLASQLEELLSNNLSATFRSAVKRIIESGYSEEIAERVILRSGLCHGSKDTVTNIADGALALLNKENDLDLSRYLVFPDLQSLLKYTMLEMICMLMEVKPALTVTEAMWHLLLCDLNPIIASVPEGDLQAELCSQEKPGDSSSSPQSKPEAGSEVTQSNTDKSQLSNTSIPVAESKVAIASSAPKEHKCCHSHVHQVATTGKGKSIHLREADVKSSTACRVHNQTPSNTESGAGRKGSSLNSKKDLLRQKTYLFEKNYKGRMVKGGSMKAKLSAWGNMVLEKTLNSQLGSSDAAMKSSSSKVNTSVKSSSPTPIAEGSAPLSVAPASGTSVVQGTDKKAPESVDYYAGIPYDESLGKYVPQNERDETILLLTPQMERLQKELQRWTVWANEKVMQAARRLGKDKPELKMLRQEKEEAEKFHKEKQMMEETTVKRLSEMEYALSNAARQIEKADSTIKRLEGENTVLKKEKQISERSAAESAINLHKALAKEQETLKKIQAGEVEKRSLQEDSSILKHETADLQKQLEKAKKRLDHFEVLWKQEERETQRFVLQAHSLKAERELVLVKGQEEEDKVRVKKERNMQKCKEDVQKLETEISQLNFHSERSKIEALKRGIAPSKNTKSFAADEVEMECVMCFSEEMSVVFLPCAHKVLCANCSVLHEKQGMKDCPSCRTLIKQRINVRYANS